MRHSSNLNTHTSNNSINKQKWADTTTIPKQNRTPIKIRKPCPKLDYHSLSVIHALIYSYLSTNVAVKAFGIQISVVIGGIHMKNVNIIPICSVVKRKYRRI